MMHHTCREMRDEERAPETPQDGQSARQRPREPVAPVAVQAHVPRQVKVDVPAGRRAGAQSLPHSAFCSVQPPPCTHAGGAEGLCQSTHSHAHLLQKHLPKHACVNVWGPHSPADTQNQPSQGCPLGRPLPRPDTHFATGRLDVHVLLSRLGPSSGPCLGRPLPPAPRAQC